MIKKILFLAFVATSIRTVAQEQPNILLIIADDMGIDVTPGFGLDGAKPVTPTLDSLRNAGITFTNCWAAPQCTPTRASIISGLYGIKTGVMDPPGPLDPEFTSIFNRAKDANLDYDMSVIGKWHLAGNNNLDHPEEHGVDHYAGLFSSGVEDYYEWTKITNGVSSTVTEYTTSHLTDLAIDWVDNQSDPWFLWLAHAAPHSPLQTPPEGLYTTEMVDNQTMFFAMIEAMDYEIGKLIHSLDENEKENTIVIFIGDNGTSNNVGTFFPRGHNKGSIYEGGLRVPLIVSGKGVSREGETDESLIHAADLHMTILDLMSPAFEGGMNNSKSLKPLFTSEVSDFREINYADYEDDGVLVWASRTSQYKLIEDENGGQEFYDVISDLEESNNLINNLTTAQETIKEQLAAEALARREGWSCNDGIQNADEQSIDDCSVVLQVDASFESRLFPNPCTGSFSVTLPEGEEFWLELLTINGAMISKVRSSGSAGFDGIRSGLYILKISGASGTPLTTQKVLVR